VLLATGRHRRYPLITATGLVLNVVLNLLLIPRFSYRAAAANTLVTEVVVASLLWLVVWRLPGIHPLHITSLLRLPVALAAGVGSGIGLRALLPWPLAAVLATAITIAAIQLLHAAGPGNMLAALRARPFPAPPTSPPSPTSLPPSSPSQPSNPPAP
jgi:O-antigen/teichoic acid export membrane protein